MGPAAVAIGIPEGMAQANLSDGSSGSQSEVFIFRTIMLNRYIKNLYKYIYVCTCALFFSLYFAKGFYCLFKIRSGF